MKTIKRILILISVIICCSCEKESHWLCHTYGGGYETTQITLEFSDDRTECEVTERDNAGGYLETRWSRFNKQRKGIFKAS